MALDLARKCGWSHGSAGSKPISGVWTLRPEGQGDMWDQPGALTNLLLDAARSFGRPDLIAVESPMEPSSRKGDGRAVASQYLLHGALYGYAGAAKIRVARAAPATIRKHLTGRATASIIIPPSTSKSKAVTLQKQATKQMIKDRLILLGLADASMGFDQTDAVAVHAYASDIIARAPARFETFA